MSKMIQVQQFPGRVVVATITETKAERTREEEVKSPDDDLFGKPAREVPEGVYSANGEPQ